jgi:DNA polymerase III subunit alpha
MAEKFVHLHLHTEYSLLDGMSKINELISHVKENKMNSVALTDHGVMYGAVEFYKKCKNAQIKPIIGMEAYTTNVPLDDRPKRGSFKNYHLLLLAKNNEGYKNLMKLTSIANIEGYYYRPRITREILAKHSKGLICSSACPAGELANAFIDNNYDEAKKLGQWFLDVFGEDYYLEVMRHKVDTHAKRATDESIKTELTNHARVQKTINEGVVKLSRDLGIPIIATNDAHYIKKEDANAQDALVCIATGKEVSDTKRLRFIDTPEFYVKSPSEMADLFSDLPESISNTVKLAEKCDVEIKLGQWFFPRVELPKGKTAEEYLKSETINGVKEKYGKITPDIKKRVEYELDIIITKGYAAYFLIFLDMANWARERRIPINTRGSVAGSIVSYSLGITTVDPIKYLLPFERFLNPFRPSAPDIDMDISDDRREDMINFLRDKYGHDKVAQICTFGRMLARGSVRDVARVLGYPYAHGDQISKLIPIGSQGFPMTIKRAFEENPELENLYDGDADVKKVVDLARQIEGNARHVSVHAAGVVISPTAITDFTPIQLEPSGEKIITQYEMWSCEDVGLVKLDVLGIRNLAILRGAVEWVRKIVGKEIDLSKIPLDDKKTFEMLSRGETMGTFQLSGSGMTRYLVELKPERIEDIMIMIALYRPGPMANIDEYIARKHGDKKIKYYHPKMEKYLDKSLGVLVFQDDLLYTALEIAGYNWEEVDKFRKAVGKKIPEEMAKQHVKFVEGCIKNSKMDRNEAEGLWKLFEPFQGYGFNKAHAASYGMVSYQTSYMKANYPVEYMCALLTAESGDTDKISSAISECRRMGINVLSPDINFSGVDFNIVDDKESLDGLAIRFGLSAIKNVGKAAIKTILDARKDSNFENFADFLSRIDARKVNKRVLESLIKVGALSEFGKRSVLLSAMDELRNKVARPKGSVNQQGLFSSDEITKASKADSNLINVEMDEFPDEELQGLERQLLGFSLSSKPLEELLGELVSVATHKIAEISTEEHLNKNVKIAAVISEIRVIVTKKSGKEMAFVKVGDGTGTIDLVVFPGIYDKFRNQLLDNNPVLIDGKVDNRDETASLIVDSFITKDTLGEFAERLYIHVPKDAGVTELRNLKKLLLSNPGNQKVCLIFEKNNKKVNLNISIEWNETLARAINKTFDNTTLS